MQVTTISIFHFSGFWNRFWALSQMGIAPMRIGTPAGLQFVKFLGSGADNGFGIQPNFSTYCLLAVWDSADEANRFFETHPLYRQYQQHSDSITTYFLQNTMAHGLWDGREPFLKTAEFDPNGAVAVITRATIRRRLAWTFWKRVPAVSADLAHQPGLHMAIGIGELPLVQQATFSVWETGKDMMQYAYKGHEHQRAIAQTRQLGWYKEELFARFVPVKVVRS